MPSDAQKEWKAACREELESLHRRNVFELVDSPKDRKIIRNRWVFDLKSDGCKKARLVAKGFSQIEGVDYDKIFSPVVWFETVQMMIALAALKKWHIQGLDIKTAFLYGELNKELYMEQPEGFKIKGQERKVMRLKRTIYGLKQAALAWWKALDKSMSQLGFTRLLSDSGIFVNKDKSIVAIVYGNAETWAKPKSSCACAFSTKMAGFTLTKPHTSRRYCSASNSRTLTRHTHCC